MRELERHYTIVVVTHNMQQAARVSDQTVFFPSTNIATGCWSRVPDQRLFTDPARSTNRGLHHGSIRISNSRLRDASVDDTRRNTPPL